MVDMLDKVTKFTPEQVGNLAYNQMHGQTHPFTCPNRGDGKHVNAYGDTGALVATVRGWICPFCDYTQDWAHGFMTEKKLPQASIWADGEPK